MAPVPIYQPLLRFSSAFSWDNSHPSKPPNQRFKITERRANKMVNACALSPQSIWHWNADPVELFQCCLQLCQIHSLNNLSVDRSSRKDGKWKLLFRVFSECQKYDGCCMIIFAEFLCLVYEKEFYREKLLTLCLHFAYFV